MSGDGDASAAVVSESGSAVNAAAEARAVSISGASEGERLLQSWLATADAGDTESPPPEQLDAMLSAVLDARGEAPDSAMRGRVMGCSAGVKWELTRGHLHHCRDPQPLLRAGSEIFDEHRVTTSSAETDALPWPEAGPAPPEQHVGGADVRADTTPGAPDAESLPPLSSLDAGRKIMGALGVRPASEAVAELVSLTKRLATQWGGGGDELMEGLTESLKEVHLGDTHMNDLLVLSREAEQDGPADFVITYLRIAAQQSRKELREEARKHATSHLLKLPPEQEASVARSARRLEDSVFLAISLWTERREAPSPRGFWTDRRETQRQASLQEQVEKVEKEIQTELSKLKKLEALVGFQELLVTIGVDTPPTGNSSTASDHVRNLMHAHTHTAIAAFGEAFLLHVQVRYLRKLLWATEGWSGSLSNVA